MKEKRFERDVDEAVKKIEYILKEYNSKLCFDIELSKIILVDQDNRDFGVFSKSNIEIDILE